MTNSDINILLVDDDPAYAEVAKSYLQSYTANKLRLTWHPEGETTVDFLKSNPDVHLILMDYYLRDRNGLEIVKELHASDIHIPIILLTGGKDFRIAVEAMKYGVDDYLVKQEAVDSLLPRSIISVLERNQLKSQVENAEKNRLISQKKTEAVGELVVTMCHEFNNPLAAIKISADILTRQCKSPEVLAMLSKMNESISSLERQIIKLRDVTLQRPASPDA